MVRFIIQCLCGEAVRPAFASGAVALVALLSASGAGLYAAGVDRWAVPVPVPFAYPVPEWADAPVVEYGLGTTSLHVPVVAGGDERELAATLYFNEAAGGFLRVQWSGGGGAVTLATNLFEGVGGPHRRTLLIPKQYLAAPGVLTVTSDGRDCLYQVEFEWLSARDVLAGGTTALPEAVLAGGREATRSELLGGGSHRSVGDAWEGDVISAPLTGQIERIEGGLVFVAPLQAAPEQARLALWITGPRMTSELRLRVNGADAGPVAFESPPLTDLGYYRDVSGDWFFAGWRKGTITIRQSLLVAGDNEIELVAVEAGGMSRPVAIRDMILQLRHPAAADQADEFGDDAGSGLPFDDVTPEDLIGAGESGGDDFEEVPAVGGIQFLVSEPDILPLE